MVPKAGLEPAWVAPQTPQACVSTNSTTSAIPISPGQTTKTYLAGAGAGVLGAAPLAAGSGIGTFFGAETGATSFMTDSSPVRVDIYANEIEVSINKTAAQVVILFSIDTGPSEPKTVWLEPPKVAPMSAPFPCCNNTITIRNRQINR